MLKTKTRCKMMTSCRTAANMIGKQSENAGKGTSRTMVVRYSGHESYTGK